MATCIAIRIQEPWIRITTAIQELFEHSLYLDSKFLSWDRPPGPVGELAYNAPNHRLKAKITELYCMTEALIVTFT